LFPVVEIVYWYDARLTDKVKPLPVGLAKHKRVPGPAGDDDAAQRR